MSTVTRPGTSACLIATAVAIGALACGSSAQAQTAPATPGALKVTASSETSLSVRWKDRSRSEAYYKVRVAGRVRWLAANRQAVTVSGLRPSVAYRVTVQACSRPGRCSKAATGMATTAGARSAPAPTTSEPGPGTPTEPAPTSAPTAPTPPPAPTSPPTIFPPTPTTTVEVTGVVTVTTGDCMPAIDPDNPNNTCLTRPVAGARVLLYAPVLLRGSVLLGLPYDGPRSPSAQATTDTSGRYHLVTEPGTTSILVDIGSGPECRRGDSIGSACPHTLTGPTQTVDLNVWHALS